MSSVTGRSRSRCSRVIRLAFLDMAHYTMVKTTMFNGIQHPHLCLYEPETEELRVVRSFEYEDFRHRLS